MHKTSDAIVLVRHSENYKILLVTRKNPPFKGEYAFPGGFIDEGEKPLDACVRELFEETDLVLNKEMAIPLTVRSIEGRDPRGPTTTYPYLFILDKERAIKAKDDAASAHWVDLDDIDQLAFDHGAILCEALGKFWPFMPGSIESRDETKLVFFGGSFNPWHEGHEECVRQFCEYINNNELIIVPDTSPWKEADNRVESFCYYKAYKDLESKLLKYQVRIFPGFWGKERPNPTIDWVKKVKAENIGFLVGDDQFASIHKWKDSKELLNILDNLFVVPRNLKDNERDKIKEEILGVANNLNIIILNDHEFRHISSTEIRKKDGRQAKR